MSIAESVREGRSANVTKERRRSSRGRIAASAGISPTAKGPAASEISAGSSDDEWISFDDLKKEYRDLYGVDWEGGKEAP